MMGCFPCKKKIKKVQETDEMTDKNLQPRPCSASQVHPQVTADDNHPGQDLRLHERCLNKQKASDAKVDELEARLKTLEEEIKNQNRKMKKMKKEHVTNLEEKELNHCRYMEEKDEKLSRQVMKIQELTDTNESLLTRLSTMASAKLTDGNPNIADLSDENRPTKLAEKYSELYDNEWTDAYDLLTNYGQTEEDACLILLKLLCTTYIECRNKANEDLETMLKAMRDFLGAKEPTSELMKPFKDQRKKTCQGHIRLLKMSIKPHIKTLLSERGTRTDSRMKTFLKKSVELCWLMVVQDPPVFMDVNIRRRGEIHDSNILKPYTKSGNYIDFIVWPPMYLQEGGSILFKGIAQCKPDNNNTETALHPLEETQNTEQPGNARTAQRGKDSSATTKVNRLGLQPSDPCQTAEEQTVSKRNSESLPEQKGDTSICPTEECKGTDIIRNIKVNTADDTLSTYDTGNQDQTTVAPKKGNKREHGLSKSMTDKPASESAKHSQRKSRSQIITTRSSFASLDTNQAHVEENESVMKRSEQFIDKNNGIEAPIPNNSQIEQSKSTGKMTENNIPDTSKRQIANAVNISNNIGQNELQKFVLTKEKEGKNETFITKL